MKTHQASLDATEQWKILPRSK